MYWEVSYEWWGMKSKNIFPDFGENGFIVNTV